MPKLLSYSFTLFLLWTFSACQKEEDQNPVNRLLKSTSSKSGDSLSHTYYAYDDHNRLTSISAPIASPIDQVEEERYRLDFVYDAQGRMESATETYNGTYSFQYDNQNRIIQKLRMKPTPAPYPGRSTYAYDSKGRLIADTLHSVWEKEIFEYTTYTYDHNDNVTEVKVFRNNAGTYHVERTYQVQYDNKQNPYKPFGNVLYYLYNDWNGREYLLSKNNRLRKTFPGGDIVSFSYAYEGDLPKSVTTTDSSDPGWTSYKEFKY